MFSVYGWAVLAFTIVDLPIWRVEIGILWDRGWARSINYDKSYRITADELAALGERVRGFAAVVQRVCGEKIASLRAAAETGGAG